MTEKIIGYILLVLGFIIIAYAGISTYFVFTGRMEPINLFAFPGISMDPAQFLQNSSLPIPREYLQNTTKTEIIPAEMINRTSNIFAYIFLMGFLVTVGYKIASVGAMLVRPIVVHLKSKEASVTDAEEQVKPSEKNPVTYN